MKNGVRGGVWALAGSIFEHAVILVQHRPNRHKPGARNFFRSRPALLSTWQPTQLLGVVLASAVVAVVVVAGAAAAAVVAAAALAALYRVSRG